MKIIQICAAYKPAYVYGGPTMSVAKLSEELAKAGQDVTVLTTTANGKTELDVPIGKETLVDGVKVHYFKRWTKDHTHFSPSLFWFLYKTIRNAKRLAKATPSPQKRAGERPIIHIHAWWNLVSIFSCLVAKLHGVKVVLSPRGMLTNYSLNNRNSKFKDAIHFFLGKRLLGYCHIHATSEKERKDVEQTCKVKDISVIPNFVEFPKDTQYQTTESEKYRLLFLSRIEQKKGLELLFGALAKVNIPWQLSIAGTGELSYIESLQELAVNLSVSSKVKWLGHVENLHKFELLAQHDLLVLTSYNENFANVVVESLAMGTPVLVSEEVGLADYVKDKELGWTVSLNIEHIISKIEQSFLANDKRSFLREYAPKKIQRDYSEKQLIAQYLEMYKYLYS